MEVLTYSREAQEQAKETIGLMHQAHISRKQEIIGVTKDDLDDILGFDGIASLFGGLGVFLFSGASWLIVENWLYADGFKLDALMGFCLSASFFGCLCLLAGLFFHNRKRGRIKKIFNQTKQLAASTPSYSATPGRTSDK